MGWKTMGMKKSVCVALDFLSAFEDSQALGGWNEQTSVVFGADQQLLA
jgi:hypothetical protein